MNTAPTPASVGQRQLTDAHSTYLSTAIANYMRKSDHARRLAQQALRRGNRSLAAGLFEASLTYATMADGLAEQQTNFEENQHG